MTQPRPMTAITTAAATRRRMLGAGLATLGLATLPGLARAQGDATPAASPVAAGEWTYTDVFGTTVTLPAPPTRIAANLVTAAALWDLGIESVAVFDWTASAHPDGDHIAWGNIDASKVANVGDIDGNIQPEEMLKAKPDIIFTLTYDGSDPTNVTGVVPDMSEAINQIAPVLVITDMESTALQLDRLVTLAESLGADLNAPEIVAAREAYEAKVAEFQEVAASKSDLSSLFVNFDPAEIYIGGPKDVAELQFLTELGLNFANADSPEATEFWEQLSVEQALKYPADVIYSDVYSSLKTLEELQAIPVFAQMPAIAAGQVGLWERDFPVSYAGITNFLEEILIPLRDAEPVAGDA